MAILLSPFRSKYFIGHGRFFSNKNTGFSSDFLFCHTNHLGLPSQDMDGITVLVYQAARRQLRRMGLAKNHGGLHAERLELLNRAHEVEKKCASNAMVYGCIWYGHPSSENGKPSFEVGSSETLRNRYR